MFKFARRSVCKFQFTVTVIKIYKLDTSCKTPIAFVIEWERGKKRSGQLSVCEARAGDAEVFWNESFEFNGSLFKEKKGWKKKTFKITIRGNKDVAKGKKNAFKELCTINEDLGKFVDEDNETAQIVELPVKIKEHPNATIKISIRSIKSQSGGGIESSTEVSEFTATHDGSDNEDEDGRVGASNANTEHDLSDGEDEVSPRKSKRYSATVVASTSNDSSAKSYTGDESTPGPETKAEAQKPQTTRQPSAGAIAAEPKSTPTSTTPQKKDAKSALFDKISGSKSPAVAVVATKPSVQMKSRDTQTDSKTNTEDMHTQTITVDTKSTYSQTETEVRMTRFTQTDNISDNSDELMELHKQIEQWRERYHSLKSMNELSLDEVSEKLREEVEALKQQQDEASQRLAEKISEIRTLNQKTSEQQETINTLRRETDMAVKRELSQAAELALLQKKLANETQRFAEQEQEWKEAQQKLKLEYQMLSDREIALREKIALMESASTSAADSGNNNGELANQVVELKQKLKSLRIETRSQQSAIELREKEIIEVNDLLKKVQEDAEREKEQRDLYVEYNQRQQAMERFWLDNTILLRKPQNESVSLDECESTAQIIFRALLEWSAFDKSNNNRICANVISALQYVVANRSDYADLCFWLQTINALLTLCARNLPIEITRKHIDNEVQKFRQLQFAFTTDQITDMIHEQYINRDDLQSKTFTYVYKSSTPPPSFSLGSPASATSGARKGRAVDNESSNSKGTNCTVCEESVSKFVNALVSLLNMCYSVTTSKLFASLSSKLRIAVFGTKLSRNSTINNYTPENRTHLLFEFIEPVVDELKKNGMSTQVIGQVVEAVFDHIDAVVVNELIESNSSIPCSVCTGLQLKMSLGAIDKWLDNSDFSATEIFTMTRQVTNLIMIYKSDVGLDTIKAVCPSLSPAILAKILRKYHPETPENAIPEDVINTLQAQGRNDKTTVETHYAPHFEPADTLYDCNDNNNRNKVARFTLSNPQALPFEYRNNPDFKFLSTAVSIESTASK